MNQADVKAICAEVLENRKSKRDPNAAPFPLSFANPRFVQDVDALDANELRQLVAAGQDGVGMQLMPADLLVEGEEEGFYAPELWDVLDANGALAYRVMMYGTDNGTVFRGDTTEIVAGCSQGGLDGDDVLLVKELISARKRVSNAPKDSCLKFLG